MSPCCFEIIIFNFFNPNLCTIKISNIPIKNYKYWRPNQTKFQFSLKTHLKMRKKIFFVTFAILIKRKRLSFVISIQGHFILKCPARMMGNEENISKIFIFQSSLQLFENKILCYVSLWVSNSSANYFVSFLKRKC